MSVLATFVFKPRHAPELVMKILESFVFSWLQWDDNGIYIHWRTNGTPDGYIKFDVETESNIEGYSETCWDDSPVEPQHLTEDMFVLLDQTGLFDAPWIHSSFDEEGAKENERVVGYGTDSPKYYSFFETELDEVIRHLSSDGSRLLSFWSDKVYICDLENPNKFKYHTQDLVDYALSIELHPEQGGT